MKNKMQKKTTVMYDLRDFFKVIRENCTHKVLTNYLIKGNRFDFIMSINTDNGSEYSIIVPDHYSGGALLSDGKRAVRIPLVLLLPLHNDYGKPSLIENIEGRELIFRREFVSNRLTSHYDKIFKNEPSFPIECVFGY